MRTRAYQAHRVSYELFVGEIPKGLLVLHACDEPGCVNPSHLFLGTHTDNSVDMRMKQRQVDRSGEKNTSAKLTQADVKLIRELREQSVSAEVLSSRFGVSKGSIYRIANGDRWAGRIGSHSFPAHELELTAHVPAGPPKTFSEERSSVHCLTPDDAKAIRERRRAGEGLREIARDYRVTETHISNICAGKVWPDGSKPIKVNNSIKMTPEKKARVKEMRRQGITVNAIAAELGVDRSSIFNMYRKH